MKQIIKLGVLGLCTLSLMGSCKKKGGEPLPPTPPKATPGQGGNTGGNPSGNTGEDGGSSIPIDNTKQIELKLASGATSFKLAGLGGKDVQMFGVTSKDVVASNGNVSEWNYDPSSIKEQSFSASSGSTIVIKGNVSSLVITEGHFENIDLSKAPITLKAFYFYAQGDGSSISTKAINFGTINSLESLGLGYNFSRDVAPSFSNVSLDLSNLTKLKRLGLYIANNIKYPKSFNELRVFWADQTNFNPMPEINTNLMPALESFTVWGSYTITNKIINFRNHQNLKSVTAWRNPITLHLDNCPQLSNINLREGEIKILSINNTPKLNTTKVIENLAKVTKKGKVIAKHFTSEQKQKLIQSGWTIADN